MKALLKYPGGKWRMAKRIVDLFPEHKFYVEPYFGGGAVFFNKTPSKHETINDVDGYVTNFFKVCRDHPQELANLVNYTPFSRDEFLSVHEAHAGEELQLTDDNIENARRFLIRCNQGFGSKLADKVGWKNTKHSTGPVNSKVWNGLPETIIAASERLKSAQIENCDAIKLIRETNAADCLLYVDPPYIEGTRRGRIYRHEMLDTDSHRVLLEVLLAHKGFVVLSGYDNELYNDMLSGWGKVTMDERANSGASRTEVLWINYDYQLRL